MRQRRNTAAVNAGSMADIAFLLLIFFLVTTTIAKDQGIARKLPKKCETGENCVIDVNERNVLRIYLGETGELLINDDRTEITELKKKLMEFIDNNGDGSCTYCAGAQLEGASDNPSGAIISLTTDRLTPYAEFISVQDEVSKAYYELRKRYVFEMFQKDPTELSDSELKKAQMAYPFNFSEASVK